MRRIAVPLLVVAVVLLGLAALGRPTPGGVAQDATPGAAAGHPLVGTWLLETDLDDLPSVVRFSADGGFAEVVADGAHWLGSWEATGERTANLTIRILGAEDGRYAGATVVRAAVEVDAGGDSFTARFTLDFVAPDGTGTGEHGPATATGTRIAVEPMGTPVGTMEELFAQFGGGTPEATPAG